LLLLLLLLGADSNTWNNLEHRINKYKSNELPTSSRHLNYDELRSRSTEEAKRVELSKFKRKREEETIFDRNKLIQETIDNMSRFIEEVQNAHIAAYNECASNIQSAYDDAMEEIEALAKKYSKIEEDRELGYSKMSKDKVCYYILFMVVLIIAKDLKIITFNI